MATTGAKKPFILSAEEKKILQKTGIPPVFAIFLKEKSRIFGTAFALRANPPVQRYLMPASPKPLSVKVKTGNWGFTKGVIAVDPILGKTEKIAGKWRLLKREADELPPPEANIIHETLHRLSLQEVLAGLNDGDYRLVGSWEDIQDSGFITLQPITKTPTHSDVIFALNLLEEPTRIERQCPIDFEKLLVSLPEREPKPTWWLDSWGNFDYCLDNYYPAQYKRDTDLQFNDILVYGVEDENKKILPITGDQDLLWISVPSKQQTLLKDFEEVIDTSEDSGIEKLYLARIALHLKLGGKFTEIPDSIQNHSLTNLGCVTPYESYVIDAINQAFSESGVKHIRNLIQHASENHNPEKLAPMDTTFVHVWRGEISMTNNENAVIQFILNKNYLPENIINVHPRWDMNKWANVITAQLTNQQPVLAETLKAYKEFRHKNQPYSHILKWVRGDDDGHNK